MKIQSSRSGSNFKEQAVAIHFTSRAPMAHRVALRDFLNRTSTSDLVDMGLIKDGIWLPTKIALHFYQENPQYKYSQIYPAVVDECHIRDYRIPRRGGQTVPFSEHRDSIHSVLDQLSIEKAALLGFYQDGIWYPSEMSRYFQLRLPQYNPRQIYRAVLEECDSRKYRIPHPGGDRQKTGRTEGSIFSVELPVDPIEGLDPNRIYRDLIDNWLTSLQIDLIRQKEFQDFELSPVAVLKECGIKSNTPSDQNTLTRYIIRKAGKLGYNVEGLLEQYQEPPKAPVTLAFA